MPEINTLNDESLAFIRSELNRCLREMGLTPNIGTITFGEKDFRVTVKGCVKWDEDNRAVNAREVEWNKYCDKKQLPRHWFGLRFRDSEGEVWEITGLKPRGRKYVVLCKRFRDGKEFGMTKAGVLAGRCLSEDPNIPSLPMREV